jgi:hypothetical protein
MNGEKQAAEGSLGSPEKRTRTKDDDEDDWDMALNTYRHFVPGYDHPVPPGQKPFAHPPPRPSADPRSLSSLGFLTSSTPLASPPLQSSLPNRPRWSRRDRV